MQMMTQVDSHEWLTEIDQHASTTPTDLLTAYAVLGVTTDLTEAQEAEGTLHLTLQGFLRVVAIEGDEWTYQAAMPPVAVAA